MFAFSYSVRLLRKKIFKKYSFLLWHLPAGPVPCLTNGIFQNIFFSEAEVPGKKPLWHGRKNSWKFLQSPNVKEKFSVLGIVIIFWQSFEKTASVTGEVITLLVKVTYNMLVVDDGFFTCEVSVQHKFQVVKKKKTSKAPIQYNTKNRLVIPVSIWNKLVTMELRKYSKNGNWGTSSFPCWVQCSITGQCHEIFYSFFNWLINCTVPGNKQTLFVKQFWFRKHIRKMHVSA